MTTQKLYGTSMLFDNDTGMVQHGELAIMTDGNGRAEIQVSNPETGDMERISDDSNLVNEIVGAIRRVHDAVDIQARCSECEGIGEVRGETGSGENAPSVRHTT